MSALASSIFSRTPDETTVVADVYTELAPGVVNSFQDSALSGFELGDQFGFLSQAKFEINLDDMSNAFSGTTESATDRISAALSDNYSKAKSYMSDLASGKTSIASAITSTTNNVTGMLRQASDTYYSVGGVVSAVKNGNLSDLRGITNTLNAVVGRSAIALAPNGALAGVYTSLIGEASAAGISDAFKIVADSVQDASFIGNKGQMIYQMASGSLPGAIQRGDLRSVASMTDYIGTGTASMLNPAAVRQISKNNTTSYTPAQIGGSGGQFVQYQGAYQKIDPNWNKSTWQPQGSTTQFKDITSLLDASSATKDVFSLGAKLSDDPNTKYFSVLDKFSGSKSVDSELTKRYPMCTAANSSNMFTMDSDPRMAIAVGGIMDT